VSKKIVFGAVNRDMVIHRVTVREMGEAGGTGANIAPQ
jgi:hypothetical protein